VNRTKQLEVFRVGNLSDCHCRFRLLDER
jgi:hypothetical protein